MLHVAIAAPKNKTLAGKKWSEKKGESRNGSFMAVAPKTRTTLTN